MGGRLKGPPGVGLALPRAGLPTWEQLLARGSAALPVALGRLCGCLELLQGQTLGQDVGLRIRARVQLGSEHRDREVLSALDRPPSSDPGFRGQGGKGSGPRAGPSPHGASGPSFVKRSPSCALGRWHRFRWEKQILR